MKDFIQKNGDEVAIVIYDAPLPPKYFRLTKRFIRTLFIVVPLFIISLILAFFLWGLGNRLQDSPSISLPKVMTETDNKFYALESEVKLLQETNKTLSEKLSAGPAAVNVNDPYLSIIKKPYGMQNFLGQNKVTLDQFEFLQNSNKVNFKFQIISSSSETRVTGHVLVLMISESGILAYPAEANKELSQGVKYSSGEPFAVSRLRPTDAVFLNSLSGESVKFIIYIFSREGDLLLIHESESFKVGAKS